MSMGLLATTACTTTGSSNKASSVAGNSKRSTESARGRLERQAEREIEKPTVSVQTLPPPPGVDEAAVAELKADPSSPVFMPTDQALAAIMPIPDTIQSAPMPVDEESRLRAVRLYVSGRTKLLENDAKGAAVDLEAASKLDPSAEEVWRELGEAQLVLARRSAAMTSFQQAVALGSKNARVITALGHEALRLGRTDEATKYLLRAWELRGDRADPGCEYIIAADLAEILEKKGYLRASGEMLRRAADLPEPFSGATRFRTEIMELYRRQSDLWLQAGDLACRFGDYKTALEAYEEASQHPTLDKGRLVTRRVHASLRLGRPAGASLLVLDQIERTRGLVEDSQFGLVRYLLTSTPVNPTLAEALREIESSLPEGSAPTIRSRLVRAQAAASTGEDARLLLRTHLATFAEDDAAAAELLATYKLDEIDGRTREMVRLSEGRPEHAKRYAFWLLDGGRESAPYLESLRKSSSRSPMAGVMRSYILAFNGHPREGLAEVREIPARPGTMGGVRLAQVELATMCGDWASAETWLKDLEGPSHEVVRAQALHALQRDAEAFELLSAIADREAGRPSATSSVLLAVELAPVVGKPEQAEGWLKRLLDADPFNETAHEAMIRLYMVSGPLADPSKLTAAVRAVRESVPSSRTLRYFNAAELVQRQVYKEAESTLLDLVEEDIANAAVLNDLITAWERQVAAGDKEACARAEAWLRAQLEQRPESIFLVGGLARVLTAEGRGEEAVTLVNERTANLPRPELLRLRESIIREVLKRPDEADALALERLSKQPPNIDTVIERMDLEVRTIDAGAAAKRLETDLPSWVLLTRDQATRVGIIDARAAAALGTELDSGRAEGVRRLLKASVDRGVRLPLPLHQKRIQLLAAQQPVDVPAVIDAVETVGRQYPKAATEAYVGAAAALSNANETDAAIRMFESLAARPEPPSSDVLRTWIQLTIARGDAAALQRLLTAFDKPELAALVINTPDDGSVMDPAAVRAEFAYTLGVVLNGTNRDDLAEIAYRRALAIKPDHAWTCNNLGYQLLEAGRDLPEAERLLESAYRSLPDEASVIDSIGWLRYKQKLLTDETATDGTVVKEGAITLLTKAVTTERGRENSDLFDHLGDALYAAGRNDEAVHRWQEAAKIANREMDAVRRASRGDDETEKKLKTQIAGLQAKIGAAQGGRRPAIAAPFGD